MENQLLKRERAVTSEQQLPPPTAEWIYCSGRKQERMPWKTMFFIHRTGTALKVASLASSVALTVFHGGMPLSVVEWSCLPARFGRELC